MQVRTILWMALFSSTFIYLVVAQVAAPPPNASPDPMMLIVMAFVSVTCAGMSFLLPAKMTGDGLRGLKLATESAESFGDLPGGTLVFKDSAAVRTRARGTLNTTFIVRLAMREAIAVNGLVLAFLGYPLPVYIGFFVVTWVLFLIAFPSDARDDAAIEQAYGAKLR